MLAAAGAAAVAGLFVAAQPASGLAAVMSAPAPQVAPKIAPPERGRLFWGAYVPGIPTKLQRWQGLIDATQHTPAIAMWYQDWSGPPIFAATAANSFLQQGVLPMVTWQPRRPPGSRWEITLRGIAKGKFDTYIRKYAQTVANYGGPLFFRPMHEMDGDWYPWSGYSRGNTPAIYIRAWRRMHQIFHDEGATNVTWVWSVNHRSVPHVWANRMTRFWPGKDYVDWVGVSGFNPGPARVPFRWVSFANINRSRLKHLRQFDKPIMVSETASPEIGGDKALWIRRMFKILHERYPDVAALIWFNQRDPKFPKRDDWRVQSSPESEQAFREGLEDARVISAPVPQASPQPGS